MGSNLTLGDGDDVVLKDPAGNLIDPRQVRTLTTTDQVTAAVKGYKYTSFSPDPSNHAASPLPDITIDAAGRLEVHSTDTSDEGSFRDDFSGSSLAVALTGTMTFTNNSATITGSGTAFQTEIVNGQWIKKTADGETLYAQVRSVSNDTTIFLESVYTGTTASTTGVISNWLPSTGSGGSQTIGSSLINQISGTTNGTTVSINRPGDYLPFTLNFYASISQRIANQLSVIGFSDTVLSPSQQATVQFTGTNNAQVNFVTSSSSAAADTQTTTVTLPAGATTNTFNTYKIDISANTATLSINGVVVAAHTVHVPGPYDDLGVISRITNQAAVTTTTLSLDYFYFSNWNRTQIDNDFSGEPIQVAGSVAPVDGIKATYSAVSGIGFAAAATPTDIFTITGSATKTIRVLRVGFSATQTTGGTANINLLRRSTANTGGTSVSATAVSHDVGDVSATATVLHYTANPTTGTLVGNLRSIRQFIGSTLQLVEDTVEWSFGNLPEKAIVLRGTAQVLAINLNAVTMTGNAFTCYVEWTEE